MAKFGSIATDPKTPFIAGFLSWLVPGAGHYYLGQRARGAIIFFTICNTFLLGVILGGKEMIDPHHAKAWFCAQALTGTPALIGALAQKSEYGIESIYGRGVDWGQVYAGVAGLLNLLCILDVVMRRALLLPSKKIPPERNKPS